MTQNNVCFSVIADSMTDSKTTFPCVPPPLSFFFFLNGYVAFCHGVILWFTKMQSLGLLISYLVSWVCNLSTLLIKKVSGKCLYEKHLFKS